jgi:hypothetical protein
MLPFLGPELLEWLLNWCTPPENKRRRTLMERLTLDSSTENEANESTRGRADNSESDES